MTSAEKALGIDAHPLTAASPFAQISGVPYENFLWTRGNAGL